MFGLSLDRFALGQGVVADINTGILFIFALSSIGVYGVVLAGWSSNSKYSLLGGNRAAAQMISYELALGLSVVGVLMLSGTLSLVGIVEDQNAFWKWNCFRQPLGFLIFLIAGAAEICRTPFDFIECENELVAGYQTEYSSMKFGLFYLAEYGHLLLLSALAATAVSGRLARADSAAVHVVRGQGGGRYRLFLLGSGDVPEAQIRQAHETGLEGDTPGRAVQHHADGDHIQHLSEHRGELSDLRVFFKEKGMIRPLIEGLALTMKHLFKPPITIQYPEQRREPFPRYRGRHQLLVREDGRIKCVACMLCATGVPGGMHHHRGRI